MFVSPDCIDVWWWCARRRGVLFCALVCAYVCVRAVLKGRRAGLRVDGTVAKVARTHNPMLPNRHAHTQAEKYTHARTHATTHLRPLMAMILRSQIWKSGKMSWGCSTAYTHTHIMTSE